MPFRSAQEVDARLVAEAPLTPGEVRELIPWMRQISEGNMRRLNSELSLQNLEAIQNFDRSSSRLAKTVIWLNWVLIALTIVIAAYTMVLATR